MKSFVFAAFISLTSFSQVSSAQQGPKLSAKDSSRVRQFSDSAFSSPLFSQKRQAWLDSALAIDPTRAWYWQQKSMPLDKQHKYELAEPYLDSAVKYDAARYLDYRAFVRCVFSKNYRSALLDFHAAKALNGNIGVMDHPYDFYIALCHLQLNAFDSSAIYLDHCILAKQQKGGDNVVHYLHWFYRGIVYYEQDRTKEAIACFDKSLKQYSNFSDAEYYKATCLIALQEYSAALLLAMKAQKDLADGYTINEDNVFYEQYPYQVRKYYLDGTTKYLQQTLAGKVAH